MRIAFIGLGVMGWPMAGHLAKAHEVHVHNRTRARAEAWAVEHRGEVTASVAEAVAGAEAVLVCLPTDADTEMVAEAAFAAMAPGTIFVDHGSGAADIARRLAARAAERGIAYLDAPVTGGRVGVEKAGLAVLVGGEVDVLARIEPAFRCFAQDVRLMGRIGAGHLTKMVNVVIGHGTGLAMAEGLGFAIAAGLDPEKVVDVLMRGSSRSWQLEHRSPAMLARDYRTLYPIVFARKDLGTLLAEARRAGAAVPISALADQIYAIMEQRGFGQQDSASLIEFFAPDEG